MKKFLLSLLLISEFIILLVICTFFLVVFILTHDETLSEPAIQSVYIWAKGGVFLNFFVASGINSMIGTVKLIFNKTLSKIDKVSFFVFVFCILFLVFAPR